MKVCTRNEWDGIWPMESFFCQRRLRRGEKKLSTRCFDSAMRRDRFEGDRVVRDRPLSFFLFPFFLSSFLSFFSNTEDREEFMPGIPRGNNALPRFLCPMHLFALHRIYI